ncbi:MAG TPA: hypothetical protein VGZ22_28740 [Isosphaeraceae bacterium]|nr:hypothetical protein [Isosphaeraceae bacterium]
MPPSCQRRRPRATSPGRSLIVQAPAELVDRLGLKDGVRVIAVDLSAL